VRWQARAAKLAGGRPGRVASAKRVVDSVSLLVECVRMGSVRRCKWAPKVDASPELWEKVAAKVAALEMTNAARPALSCRPPSARLGKLAG